MDAEQIKQQRDRKLRHDVLEYAYLSRVHSPSGMIEGSTIYANIGAEAGAHGGGFESEQHFIALARDLVAKGLLTEKHTTIRVGERFAPRHIRLGITDKGAQLYRQVIGPDPDIYDGRLHPET